MTGLKYYELLMIIVPMLLLFLAIYLLFRQFFQNQYKLYAMKSNQEDAAGNTRLKLQAYERLMLFCERVTIQSLLLRIQSSAMSVTDLRAALVLAVQQEFEYNLSQQLYVSEALWQIIQLAKNQVIEIIIHISDRLPQHATAEDLSRQLIVYTESQKTNPIDTAKLAVKKEASLVLQ